VWVFDGFDGTAAELEKDGRWAEIEGLFIVPDDPTSRLAFANHSGGLFEPEKLEQMGQTFHARYLEDTLNGNQKSWEKLEDTYKNANRKQAEYAVTILKTCGFATRLAQKPLEPKNLFNDFTDNEIEHMAELEHGRWNVERLRDGWHYGKKRDNKRKIHPCIVSWVLLPDDIKKYDRDAVREFPAVLAQAGLEVYRVTETTKEGEK
jgi:hypothetical protein